MNIYDYEGAFGAADMTSAAMRKAMGNWYQLYYGDRSRGDPCQKVAYTVVTKLIRAMFGEYAATGTTGFGQSLVKAVESVRKEAVSQALVGGACFLKPCPGEKGFSFRVVARPNVLIFARDAQGKVTDMGTVEKTTHGKYFYTLLERRTVDRQGYLTLRNTLYRSLNDRSLGQEVPLNSHPDYGDLVPGYVFSAPLNGVGLVELRTPILNCVDGSGEAVSVYAAAAELIGNIDENEAQLSGEFRRGQSRIVVSGDMLGAKGLEDHVFVGLDDDPEHVGITIFSPNLREQSFLARKQEYLRNVESIVGLKRGMLSDANMDERTATEIAASAGDFNLTVIDLQHMWQEGLEALLSLCGKLGALYGLEGAGQPGEVSVDWGNGVLYDEDKTWEAYRTMVEKGLLKPEIALGWRFGRPAETKEQQAKIREDLMPESVLSIDN